MTELKAPLLVLVRASHPVHLCAGGLTSAERLDHALLKLHRVNTRMPSPDVSIGVNVFHGAYLASIALSLVRDRL